MTVRFKRFMRADVVAGDGVYLTSERSGQIRLQGALVESLAPWLDGKHDRGEILSALADRFSVERVNAVLDKLVSVGHVIEGELAEDERAAGFWEMHGRNGDAALTSVRDSRVQFVRFGDVSEEGIAAAAAAAGLSLGGTDPSLTVVLVDDYLHPELQAFNEESLRAGRPWLLAKPIGGVVWVGPVFEPGRTACWSCLAVRLSSNQMVMHYLQQRNGLASPPVTSLADLSATRRMGVEFAALHAAKWLAGGLAAELPTSGPDAGTGYRRTEVVTFDLVGLQSQKHVLTRRPQCRACGDPGLQSRLQETPVRLTSRPKLEVVDGGHRSKSPEKLLAEYEPLISPITGPVKQLIKTPMEMEGLHTYYAGQNFAVPMGHVSDLRAGLRSAASGKGMSDVQARASAVGEAIERYSGLFRGDEARITASYRELGPERAIAPNELHQYSDAQFATRDEWNARGSHFQRVCDPFDPEQRIDWTPVWSLSRQQTRYLPTASLFFGYPLERGNRYGGADSNGNAAGTSLEDAVVQGFMELVERDSVAIWWYNMVRRPGIDLAGFQDPYFETWQQRYRAAGRETWALDLTTDLGIPTVATVSRRIDKPVEDILIAFGAHFDVKIAISRAMTEMNQFLPAVMHATAEAENYTFPDPDQHNWWRTATLANQPYLRPLDGRLRAASDFTAPGTTDLVEDVRLAQRIVEGAGMEMLVLDQTRPDIGLPVVKVLVPGMRHFWTRYAPGRLYDVPVAMGWLDRPMSEADLNPVAMFL
ncbi:TOMM precursor leader peptide-binding protein [Streptacidiphilus jiangxiensis]|uniref:Ribosomal protein S12 methylthiotransferase accessory factor n=1 Tax=Streptacidiphilus jiangxiensis TaxID=235985 RepID=A0A1H7KQY6_STRJI|nr:TOMM precursor leader peptide-binding protein [Streptacidiphilus jiangxiensis]SEK89263.1 ribosomal protein S12 methylthiotransferase accessory factor [Streptacidiphilus jiangxiensis]